MNYVNNIERFLKGIGWLWTREWQPTSTAEFTITETVGGMQVARRVHKITDQDGRAYNPAYHVQWQPGWNAWKFLPIYLFDVGTRVLFGGAVVTWSGWFYLTRQDFRVSAFITRLLNHAENDHGRMSRWSMWGTDDTQYAAQGAWLALALLVLCVGYWLWRLFT